VRCIHTKETIRLVFCVAFTQKRQCAAFTQKRQRGSVLH